jgi:23S rRNA G2069 N7-methylase RlmK/C1962 C5-methylase RlmI
MADKSTFIKLDRNIQEWRWYTNANTFRVFIHLLLNANIKSNDFENAKIGRGQLATSYDKIANTLKLTNQQVRTAISHLKSTGEITIKRYSKFLVISIVNYAQYQDKLTIKSTINQQSPNNHSTINQQQLKNIKNNKECKEEIDALSGEKKVDENGRELNEAGLPVIQFFKDRPF